MFIELLYPLGFLAAAGIFVPVLIHLWRKERRNVLRVGSIRLFDNAKKQRINRVRIANWPLLLVRCFLILILAMLLAAPYVDLNRPKADETGWVLLGAGYGENLGEDQQRLVDSLRQRGYGLRAFEPGFRPIDGQGGDTVAPAANPFSLVHQLNETLPADFPVVIFSHPRIGLLTGEVPSATTALTWHGFAQQEDSARTQWATHAWKTPSDEIALAIASSSATETRFEQLIVQGDGRQQGVQMKVEQGQALVRLASQPEWVTVDDRTWRVCFAADAALPDVDYLKALLTAFQQATDRPMEMGTFQPGDTCDLLFDFTAAGVTDTAAARNVFRYVPGEPVDQQDNYLVHEGFHTAQEKTKIHQMIVADDDGTPIWSDAFGRPLLTASEQQGQTVFRCYTRFNPQWTDLIWSDAFINSLVPLLADTERPLLAGGFHAYPMDERTFAGTVTLPHRAKTARDIGLVPKRANAVPYLAWFALLVFAAERVMTYRAKPKPRNGKYERDGKYERVEMDHQA